MPTLPKPVRPEPAPKRRITRRAPVARKPAPARTRKAKDCATCRTAAAGLPTPGYVHTCRPAPARTKRPRSKSKNKLPAQRTKTWDLFAAYVKQRDGNVCFSCGKGGLISHDWHAGHMFPSGNNAVIRYEPKNVHSQCGRCNCFLRGNGAAYVAHFLEVYGLAELQRIQAKRGQEKRWTRVELEEMATVLQRGGADFECWYAERYGLEGR